MVVLAVRPRFVGALLDGTKRYEFRRVRTSITRGTTALIYATSPLKVVVGAFTVGEVISGPPNEIVALEQDVGLIGPTRAYLDGAQVASAIEVVDPRPTPSGPLGDILPGVQPPQSYVFVGR